MSRVGRPPSIDSNLVVEAKTLKPTVAKHKTKIIRKWELKATVLIKERMLARRWRYRDLAEALRAQGYESSPALLNRRINRGNFTAAFLMLCLDTFENWPSVPTNARIAPKRSPQ